MSERQGRLRIRLNFDYSTALWPIRGYAGGTILGYKSPDSPENLLLQRI
jgi:hypothetical protein